MRRTAALLTALALLPVARLSAQAIPPNDTGTWAFVGVHVLPMDREVVLEEHTVVVENGLITAVGPAGLVEIPADARRIDGAGRYLMPGLAEMHAHVPPVPTGSDARPPAEALTDLLFLYVANGVTTIRGMLGSSYQLDLREEINRGDHLAPAFYAGAPSINGGSAPTPEAAEVMIRSAAEAGYDLQKIHPGVSRESWDRMVEVAEEVGLTYGGHVPAAVGLDHALATGMSTVDHLDGYLEASVPDEIRERALSGTPVGLPELLANLDESRMRELARRTREVGAYVVPTAYLWENLYGGTDTDAALSQPEMAYVSPQQRQAWRNQAAGRPQLPAALKESFFDARLQMLKMLADEGETILMGTDSPQLFNVPGFALHRELQTMAAAGLTPYQILVSGTRTVARYVADILGQEANFGTVLPGQRADLVLLEANPMEDVSNLRARAGVMVRGRWVPASEIQDGLDALARKHGDS